MAGIQVFSTGGLGGVHQGGEISMDISADLSELSRTPVAVICSGCKGFLDIPRTLQYLETQGVAVATFRDGRVGPIDFPAFWSRDSGVRSPEALNSAAEAAAVIRKFFDVLVDAQGANLAARRTTGSRNDIRVPIWESNTKHGL